MKYEWNWHFLGALIVVKGKPMAHQLHKVSNVSRMSPSESQAAIPLTPKLESRWQVRQIRAAKVMAAELRALETSCLGKELACSLQIRVREIW